MKQAMLVVCFVATICFGQGSISYHNSQNHFSFMLPEGWEYVNKNGLPSKKVSLLNKTFKSNIEALCQKSDSQYFTTPYILVQFLNTEEVPETMMENLFLTGKIGTKGQVKSLFEKLQEKKGCLPEFWGEAKWIRAEVFYDKTKHFSFGKVYLHHEHLGDIIAITVKFLGSHRMVTLKFYADGNDTENFDDLVNEVVDSFRFNEGYGFEGAKGIGPGLTKKLLNQSIWSWIWPIIVISVIFWLLQRWVRG